MRTAHRKAMSTSIMLVMAAVVLLVLTLLIISILQKPASKTAEVGKELTPLLGGTLCDIKCFDCCNRDTEANCNDPYKHPDTKDCGCKCP